ANQWDQALAAFEKAHQAKPSGATAIRAANALYQLDRLSEAQQAYRTLLDAYDKTLFNRDKTTARKRLEELNGKIGSLTVRVSEKGATVLIDGTPAGTSPLAAALQVPVGDHQVEVKKGGFRSYAKTVKLTPGAPVTIEVLLQELATVGHIKVTAAGDEALTVLIDGTEVGPVPYKGQLEPGSHKIAGTSEQLEAPAQTVIIEAGELLDVVLEAGARTGTLEVRLTDEVGTILVDGTQVGKGNFQGRLPAGAHTLRVTREGYEPFEKTVKVVAADVHVETVSLQKATSGDAQAEQEEGDWTFDGLYGGLQLGAMFLPTHTGHTLDTACDTTGATSCDGGLPAGATIGGFIGYAFAPVGFELLVVGGADMVEPTASFDGTTGSDINPLVAQPEREEEFIIGRFGGGGALRARVLIPIDRFRLSGALGAGLAYRHMILGRTVTASDGREAETSDGGTGYLTPVLSFEFSAQVRVTGSAALALGLNLWLEHAGNDMKTAAEGDVMLTKDGQLPHPLATPAYDMATGTQLYMGPFLGLQLGP
ncbi:MAG: hypothetical protein DRI90_19685, partial [Deltaproteobacteria bacterium]